MGDEGELADALVGAQPPRGGLAAAQVVLEQRVASVAPGRLYRVPVTIRPADEPVIDARVFLWIIVEAGLADLAVGEVNGPALQGGGPSLGPRNSVSNIFGCRTTSRTIELPSS
jgi:hypothetical protein